MMISVFQTGRRLRRMGQALLLAFLLLAVSLILIQMNALAAHSGGGGGNCGSLNGAVAQAVDGDIVFINTIPTAGPEAQITKNLIIQGGWIKNDPGAECPELNPYYNTITEVQQLFTYSETAISTLDLTGSGDFIVINSNVLSLTIQQLELRDNSSGRGISGVIDNGAEVHLDRLILRNNQTGNGGGLNLDVRGGSRLVMSNTQFIDNYSYFSEGGGFYIRVFDNSEVIIHNTQVYSNRTGGSGKAGGGRIIIDSGVVTVSNSIFNGNQTLTGSDEDGGGLSIESTDAGTATVWLVDNIFEGNTSISDGGGLHLDGNNLEVHMINNILAGNQAGGFGAGLFVEGGATVHVLHTTIADATTNSKQGIHVAEGTAHITNTIIANHSEGIRRGLGEVTEDYNLFYSNTTNLVGTINSGGHSLIDDPDFVNPAGGDYHLGQNSAAIDQAVDAGISADFEGDPRPVGAGPDIGADERAVLTKIYLPAVLKNY